ncbi:histidine phosphatase family protein [Paucibacter sp. Y2R2-4]|uniref:histidine phosphatase family protein n=1 Tax=Paucibacter sp. Y2R2-4 TaxID=2893553 RepID=UPI0021E49B52|nr:histidine phosphatase family protein [Paucibacter sp. Y2R2-4]MCV2349914.1 histidine phosphatase family protein [Paucibacter sp. Y2R2-4]
MSSEARLWVWRHPRPEAAAGRCIGAGSDLTVHWRRAKRLARKIQKAARRQRLPHIVYSSPLRRCASVAAWLKAWGWRHHVDAALLELDFGEWEGKPWFTIAKAEVDAWVQDFANHAPGGGESLTQLLERAGPWQPSAGHGVVISHGGWMLARRWLAEHGQQIPTAANWSKPPRYGECWQL